MSQAEQHTIWRVVFPSSNVGLDESFRIAAAPIYGSGHAVTTAAGTDTAVDDANVAAADTTSSAADNTTLHDWIVSRTMLEIPAGHVYSTGSYYNAFPAAYWAQWTNVQNVALRMQVRGNATVTVHQSDSHARDRIVSTVPVSSSATPQTVEATISIAGMRAGGWLWFDVAANDTDSVTLADAVWLSAAPENRTLTASLAITTMNKPEWCIRQFNLLANMADMSLIDAIYVVDQGSDLVTEHDGYAEAKNRLGDKLRIIRQGNVGGSGGFARGMYEVERHNESGYALLLDDDTVLEPESISRAIAFANHCIKPTLVGGNMLFLSEPTRLCALAEVFNRTRVFWTPAEGTPKFDDLAARPFLDSTYLHKRVDADYNAWWMCLIPVEAIRKIGLSYPFFIKNDDVEYGVRAQQAGFRTVTVPGVCLWHQSFVDKDDILDWQAYFHVRNKIIMGLLYSRLPWGGDLFREMLRASMSAAIKMRYSAVTLHQMAVNDVLQGAEHIGDILESRLPQIRAAREAEPDTRMEPLNELPDTLLVKDTKTAGEALSGMGAMLHQLVPPRRDVRNVVDGYVEPQKAYWKVDDTRAGLAASVPLDGSAEGIQSTLDSLDMVAHDSTEHWRVMGHMDSAIFVNKDKGTGVLLRRRPFIAALRLAKVAFLYGRLAFRWRKYQSAYRKAFATMVSPEWWQRYFAGPVD
ncbi:glycosyl transferase [Bifidobacterium ramosum]|uniref:Glycosyl transferase n=1 Tax=Bifidobacterium ramosum TaxID=1798158 RepID=A0A6L4X3N7_9BIFI|nr:glycosyltransferase [Bifidobacterium ramosum]KAB8288635.1 glycosyl transferase [Bifidobacterium ramosum]NEG71501.1 glycosyltransferase [Bifidobacterium ramosum]